jgi:hypothetical protein
VKANANCTELCELNVCGDGVVNPGNDNDPDTNDLDGSQTESCDPGQLDSNLCYSPNSSFGPACSFTYCGDGLQQSLNGLGQQEQCDDGPG